MPAPVVTHFDACSFSYILYSRRQLDNNSAYHRFMEFHLDDATQPCECGGIIDGLPERHEYVTGYRVHYFVGCWVANHRCKTDCQSLRPIRQSSDFDTLELAMEFASKQWYAACVGDNLMIEVLE